MRTYDIFISHPSESTNGARKLNEKLRALKFSTFFDHYNLTMEPTWDNSLETALKNSRAMVIFCNDFYDLEKPAVAKEWNYFLNFHPKNKVIIVGPKEQAYELPARLHNMQVLDKKSSNVDRLIYKRFHNELLNPSFKHTEYASLNIFSKLTNRVTVNPKTYSPTILAFTILLMTVGFFLLSSFTNISFLQLLLFGGIMIFNAFGSMGLMLLNRFKRSNSALLLNTFISLGFFIASAFISLTNNLYASLGIGLLFSSIALNGSYLFNIFYLDKNCDVNSLVSIISSSLLYFELFTSYFSASSIFNSLGTAPIAPMAIFFSTYILLMIFAIKWIERTYPYVHMSFFSFFMYFITLIFVFLPYFFIKGTNAINYWIALTIFILCMGHFVHEFMIFGKNVKYYDLAYRKLGKRRR